MHKARNTHNTPGLWERTPRYKKMNESATHSNVHMKMHERGCLVPKYHPINKPSLATARAGCLSPTSEVLINCFTLKPMSPDPQDPQPGSCLRALNSRQPPKQKPFIQNRQEPTAGHL